MIPLHAVSSVHPPIIYMYIRRPLGKGERAWELWCQMRSNGASNLVMSRCVCAWFWGLFLYRASESNVRQVSADPSTFCFGFACMVACRLPKLSLRKVFPCWRQSLFFDFHGFRRRRFGSFFCLWIRMVWARNLLGFAVLLMRFVGNASALFVVAVSHGLDTNPAAVRLFRKRSAKGFGR